ncbi:MAG: Ig-like domain-containing protein, partial [Planctomycetota bacterium]|nr:Ig-like domain-containing protein [Planctomycetota bacterium]
PGRGQIQLSVSPSATFEPVPMGTPSPTQSTVVANPLSNLNSNGSDSSAITVTVRDSAGNTLSNQSVNLSSGAGTNFAAATGTTNAQGVFATTLTSTQPGSRTVRAIIDQAGNNVLSASQPVIVFSAPPGTPDPSQSAFTASPITGITADGVDVSNLQVTVRDPSGATLANQTVQLSVVGTSTTLTPASGTTNAQGIFTATLSTIDPGVKTVTATINPGASQVTVDNSPTISFSPRLIPNKFQSEVVVTPNMGVFANGKQTATIDVTVRDVNRNVLPGREVMIMATGTNNTIAQMMGVTNGAGVFSTTISTTDAGTKNLTANIDPNGTPLEIDTKPDVTFDVVPPGPDAALSTVVANPTMGLTANGTATSTITVTVVDAANCPLVNQMVTLSSSGTNNTFTPATGMTNAMGVFTATLSTTTAEAKVITATINPTTPVVLTAMPTVTFTP